MTAVFSAVAELADVGGLYTPEAAAVVSALARALDVKPQLPERPAVVTYDGRAHISQPAGNAAPGPALVATGNKGTCK